MIKSLCKKELLNEHHKVRPIRAINKYNSRFAYKIYVNNKPIAGEWGIDAVNISNQTTIYKKIGKGC